MHERGEEERVNAPRGEAPEEVAASPDQARCQAKGSGQECRVPLHVNETTRVACAAYALCVVSVKITVKHLIVPRTQVLIELAPSILSADFAHLAEGVQRATEGGASVIHV